MELSKKVNQEVEELRKKYPKLDLSELAKDELFKECLNGRAGRWTQVEIYELYLSKKAEATKKAEEDAANQAAEEAAKKISAPPSSTAKGTSPQQTVDDFKTLAEFDEYFNNKYS